MTLTMPVLILCWTSAALAGIATLVLLYRKRYWPAALTYFLTGFLHLALPFKIALKATSLFGMMFLSAVWPVWDGQAMLGYHLGDILPTWFLALLFNV